MATHHAAPGEVVNLETWARDLPVEKSKAIVKTSEMELARLIVAAGEGIEDQHVDGPLVLYCVSGIIELSAMGRQQNLAAGELVHLEAGERFSVKGEADAQVLATFVFT